MGGIVVTYWLAFRWVLDRFHGDTPRSRLDHCFRSSWTGGVLLSLAGIGILCMAYGLMLEPRRVTVKAYAIETSKLPLGQRVRLVHMADLHVRENGPRERTLPDIVRLLHPDVILHTGDVFGTRTDVASIIVKLLRSWDVPQYACEGNLDGLGDFKDCMRQAGVITLNGIRPAICKVRGIRLSISGFPSGAEPAMRNSLRGLSPDDFNIVLYHHPEGFPETWETRTDLMLAGHTHGGQVRLPFYGALITLDRFSKRWESGLFDEHGVKLVVSRGLGCEPGIPEMRFCCPPEVVVIDLIGRSQHPEALR
ncbi:MAG: metallophosphoesterase [Verrucomicrobia bacterium]|nr:metallophosphoesterase [Verrucomicrobiota bacterium]